MSNSVKIRVQEQDFNLQHETDALLQDNDCAGALATFVGVVRNNQDNDVIALELEHYPGMTESALRTIVENAMSRWDINRVTVIHRVGKLKLNQKIVFVGVTSPHRGSSFEACEFIMDFLKTRAPFWKKEHTKNGTYWVEARQSDEEKVSTWK